MLDTNFVYQVKLGQSYVAVVMPCYVPPDEGFGLKTIFYGVSSSEMAQKKVEIFVGGASGEKLVHGNR